MLHLYFLACPFSVSPHSPTSAISSTLTLVGSTTALATRKHILNHERGFSDSRYFQNEAHTHTDVPLARHELWSIQANGDFRKRISNQTTAFESVC